MIADFFPFDIVKIDGEFFWIIWNVKCSITNYNEKDFEPCLQEFEKDIIPSFKNHLEEYAAFKPEGLHNTFSYKVVRKVNLS